MRALARRWDAEAVKQFLINYMGINEYDIEELPGGDILVAATPEHPAVFFDSYTGKLTIEYPEETEELPNPDSSFFYPDIRGEYKTPGEVKRFIKEELGEDDLHRIEKICGDDYECLVDQAYEAVSERLKDELEKEIEALEKSKPRHVVYCGVPVTVKTDVYEETKYDPHGVEYTAYYPSTTYTIDLDKVPDEETLKCVLEKIKENL